MAAPTTKLDAAAKAEVVCQALRRVLQELTEQRGTWADVDFHVKIQDSEPVLYRPGVTPTVKL